MTIDLVNTFNQSGASSVIPWNQEVIIMLLAIIAICEVTRTGFFLYYQALKLFGVNTFGRKGEK